MLTLLLCSLALAQPSPTADPSDSGALATTEIGSTYDIGVGVALGNPTGVSAKMYLDGRRTAIEGVIGTESWGPGYGGLYLHSAFLWHPGTVVYDMDFEMAWHIGGGAFLSNFGRDPGNRFDNWSDSRLSTGLRGQVGLDLDMTVLPLQVYGDVAMNFLLIPKPWPGLHISAGVRYFF